LQRGKRSKWRECKDWTFNGGGKIYQKRTAFVFVFGFWDTKHGGEEEGAAVATFGTMRNCAKCRKKKEEINREREGGR